MAAKKDNWIPWAIAAGAVFLLLRGQPRPTPEPSKPNLKAVVSSAIPSIRAAYKQAFLDAAAKIEAGEIANQEQWTKFIEENAGAKRTEAMNKVYTAIDELKLPVTFAGKEKELAKINREISEAW